MSRTLKSWGHASVTSSRNRISSTFQRSRTSPTSTSSRTTTRPRPVLTTTHKPRTRPASTPTTTPNHTIWSTSETSSLRTTGLKAARSSNPFTFTTTCRRMTARMTTLRWFFRVVRGTMIRRRRYRCSIFRRTGTGWVTRTTPSITPTLYSPNPSPPTTTTPTPWPNQATPSSCTTSPTISNKAWVSSPTPKTFPAFSIKRHKKMSKLRPRRKRPPKG